ncbi:MAG: tRNA-dihydrouridine synthase [Gammaproteobacteria bacterium]|nr:tRNA-dihydrouridine synthase [Gammaproteobacteria bacterium]MCW8958208.1 tRNA-dihydrouridine synthase [Gammaproteobacteria bacterium]MCW9089696.1 tRNA-dihydrouridine synthase [Gammaproteobacteria bacterium]
MRILLAPMEGVVDPYMRELLTRIGGYDGCVTEFLRVTRGRVPRRNILRICPEISTGGRTASGIPVTVQLLGGDAEAMALNAGIIAGMGAPGIDLNFGCPSKQVNANDGGAILLKKPERIYAIVAAVRQAVPDTTPVSAKIRLGVDDTALALENAHAVEDGGADFITVHARTRADGYRAPARWEWLAAVNEALSIPVIANGDIRSVEEYWRCREMSGCEDVMIGRAAVGRPDLALQIRYAQQQRQAKALHWQEVRDLMLQLGEQMAEGMESRHVATRLKQWLTYLKQEYREAVDCFEQLRRLRTFEEMVAAIRP